MGNLRNAHKGLREEKQKRKEVRQSEESWTAESSSSLPPLRASCLPVARLTVSVCVYVSVCVLVCVLLIQYFDVVKNKHMSTENNIEIEGENEQMKNEIV